MQRRSSGRRQTHRECVYVGRSILERPLIYPSQTHDAPHPCKVVKIVKVVNIAKAATGGIDASGLIIRPQADANASNT